MSQATSVTGRLTALAINEKCVMATPVRPRSHWETACIETPTSMARSACLKPAHDEHAPIPGVAS